jgi:hypothetical protein
MNSRRRVNSAVMSLHMKFICYSLGAIALLAFSSVSSFAKPWRGLVPLLTTRAQVVEMLGSPKLNSAEQTESFDLANEVVVLRWIRPTCGTETPIPKGESFQPSDVVLQITVNPKVPLKATPSDFQPNTKNNRDWLSANISCLGHGEGKWSSCSIIYDGYGYSTSDAGITALYYFPSASDAKDWNATNKSCSPSGARHNKSLDASGGSVFRITTGPAMLE